MFCKNCGSQVPEGTAFCAACGTPVAAPAAAPVAAPAAAPNPAQAAVAAVKGNNTIKLIAIIAAVAIVLGLFIGLLGGGNPKSVAKKYVEASIEGDVLAQFDLEAGKMQKQFEKETDDDTLDWLFEMAEESADELDLKVKVNNVKQYYKAAEKITKASNKENYGKNYKLDIKVLEVKDMRNSDIEDIQDRYDIDEYEDYINVDKIKKGKKVAVSVIIDGSEDRVTKDYVVSVVKYGGKWKVAGISYGKLDD